MKVLVAGPSGALGAPTVRELVSRGHEVIGLTRSEAKADTIRGLGATPVFGDVLVAGDTKRVIADAQPETVVQLLNALPKRGPIRASEIEATSELRTTGTRNLLDAALQNGVRRYLVESMIFGYGYGGRDGEPLSEDAPFGVPTGSKQLDDALGALTSMEGRVLGATESGNVEGIVLRLGLFYGAGIGSTEFMLSMLRKRILFLPGEAAGRLSWIHVEDGARAVAEALERAEPGSVFNVVDDEPASFRQFATTLADAHGLPGPKKAPLAVAKKVSSYASLMATTDLRVSNARLKEELGWSPGYPTIRAGIDTMASTSTLSRR